MTKFCVNTQARRANHGRIAGLDVLRGVAVGLVLIRHGFLPSTGATLGGATGVVGVVIFFALSGYLITGLLVSDIHRFGRVRYGRFYRNRILRLYPALLLFVAAVVVVSCVADFASDRSVLGRTIATALTYTVNLPWNHGSSAIDHLWTLSTEEQFYLVWPLVLFLGIRYRRLRLAVALSATIILAALLITITHYGSDLRYAYGLPSSWAIAMVIGSAAQLGNSRLTGVLARVGIGRVAAASAVVLLLLALLPENKSVWATYLLLAPAAAIAAVVVIFYLRAWIELPASGWVPVHALGRVSYAAYLWNYGVVVWMGGMGLPPLSGILSVVLTIGAATVSWYTVEKPALRLKARLDRRASERPGEGINTSDAVSSTQRLQ